jgi:signal transduction histidine kinase
MALSLQMVKRSDRWQRLKRGVDPASLQFRLTLGIGALLLLGLGSIGTWTIWDMRQMLLVKHKQALEQVADRFADGLEKPTSEAALTQQLQQKVDQWSSPNLWIWIKANHRVKMRSANLSALSLTQVSAEVAAQAQVLENMATMPSLPEVQAVEGRYFVLCSRTLDAKGMTVGQLYLAQDITHDYKVLSSLINSLRWATLVAIATLALLLTWLIWRSLRPLRHMNRQMAAGNLSGNLADELEDIPSEVKDLVQAFGHLSTRLSENGMQQRQFTDSMSHELRTSLSLIYGYLQSTLRRCDNLTSPQKAALEVAIEETEHTIQLLGTLLDLAKVNQGEMAFHWQTIQLNDWLSQWATGEQMGGWSEDVIERLQVQVGLEPLSVLVDVDKLQQVMSQLLENALRYSDAEEPIAVRLIREGQEAVIQVSDRGCGIPPSEQSRIFEPFYRLEPSRCRRTGGIGLGLAIVKSLVESMDGSVGVKSTLGEGSVFEVRLPIQDSGQRLNSKTHKFQDP